MPRAGLTSERVVAEAAALADTDGAAALSLAGVAGRLGVAVPSLYKHVGGLPDLQRRVARRGLADLAGTLETAAGARSGRSGLRACATAYRRWARERPGVYALLQRAPADEATRVLADRLTDVLLGVLAGYGLRGARAVHAARAVRSALHGFVVLEAEGGFGLPEPLDTSFAQLVAVLDRGLAPGS